MVGRDVVSWMLSNVDAASLVLRVSLLSLGTSNCFADCPEGKGSKTHSTQVSEGLLLTRAIAVSVGQAALQAGLLEHVVGEHDFEDKTLFYRTCRLG